MIEPFWLPCSRAALLAVGQERQVRRELDSRGPQPDAVVAPGRPRVGERDEDRAAWLARLAADDRSHANVRSGPGSRVRRVISLYQAHRGRRGKPRIPRLVEGQHERPPGRGRLGRCCRNDRESVSGRACTRDRPGRRPSTPEPDVAYPAIPVEAVRLAVHRELETAPREAPDPACGP